MRGCKQIKDSLFWVFKLFPRNAEFFTLNIFFLLWPWQEKIWSHLISKTLSCSYGHMAVFRSPSVTFLLSLMRMAYLRRPNGSVEGELLTQVGASSGPSASPVSFEPVWLGFSTLLASGGPRMDCCQGRQTCQVEKATVLLLSLRVDRRSLAHHFCAGSSIATSSSPPNPPNTHTQLIPSPHLRSLPSLISILTLSALSCPRRRHRPPSIRLELLLRYSQHNPVFQSGDGILLTDHSP